MNMLTGSHSSRGARAAKPESFDGSRDKAEQFIQSIHITMIMQLDTFSEEIMKIQYALSFMQRRIVQVWAETKTNVVLSHTSTFSILMGLLACIERSFRDPD